MPHIIEDIYTLCKQHKYDEAIAMTNKISDKIAALEAHLLCIEHEQRQRLDGKLGANNESI